MAHFENTRSDSEISKKTSIMNKFFAIILFTFSSNLIFGQSLNLDSLKKYTR